MTTQRRKRPTSPTLQITITDAELEAAIRSNSGGCLISDAIMRTYPNLTRVETDMATIRATDKAKGERYIYLTPKEAQHVLLSFDQGWPNPVNTLTIKRAVQIMPITRPKSGPSSSAGRKEKRDARRAELQLKLEQGEDLTKGEKDALTKLSKPYDPPERPSTRGPVEVVHAPTEGPVTIRGGRPPMVGEPHPNLLRGRDRHFGAKLADPGIAFRDAVDEAVRQRLAEQDAG